MINELEKSQLQAILFGPQWKVVERVAELVINRIRSENTIRESEWDTLKDTIFKEGRASGIEYLFQELIKLASNDTDKTFKK